MLRIYIGPMYAGKTTLLMNMFVENPSDKKKSMTLKWV